MNDSMAMLSVSLGDEGARALLGHFEATAVADGEVLFREGSPSSVMLFLVDGQVEILQETNGLVTTIGTRGPGAWLGEVGFIDAGPATATVIVRGAGQILRIDHTTLLRIATSHPEAASVLLRHVSRQLAQRIAEGSAGIIDHVGDGHYRIRKPEEVRSWASRMLGWLVGGAA